MVAFPRGAEHKGRTEGHDVPEEEHEVTVVMPRETCADHDVAGERRRRQETDPLTAGLWPAGLECLPHEEDHEERRDDVLPHDFGLRTGLRR